MEQTFTFYVAGMHCKLCVLLIENELRGVSYITSAKSSLKDHSVVVTGNFGGRSPEAVAMELSHKLRKHGYSLSIARPIKEVNWSEFKIAIPIATVFIALFVLLQKAGLLNLIGSGELSYGGVFMIGVVASLSTCMAVVGGLLLSMSATFAKEGDKWRPQLLFHIGRVASFFILGGMIGALGSAFVLNTTMTFLLNFFVGLVMLIMGVNLLDTFHLAKRFQIGMPKVISRYAIGVANFNHTFTPFLVGIATFFLPCGFTQSMQLYTLSAGSFLSGGLTMLSFALGTLPVLALISFSSFSIKGSSGSGVFFKTAGLIVILFALFNIINSLVVIGLFPPVFNF
ncbi:MAG: sulfite exporter TauE/SafE family protein [Candidatus Vogelbacteria bacterium]|nr:sulfite exporter TauE/SafE family protein [Candidatus Vogelbacteria bacterium]